MVVKDAFVRAVRTAAQAAVGMLILTGVPVFKSVDEVKAAGIAFGFALVSGLFAGTVAFLQNIAEDNTSAQLPK